MLKKCRPSHIQQASAVKHQFVFAGLILLAQVFSFDTLLISARLTLVGLGLLSLPGLGLHGLVELASEDSIL